MTSALAGIQRALFVPLLAVACGGGQAAPVSPSQPASAGSIEGAVGASGGTVSLAGGAVKVLVPAGAVNAAVTIQARLAGSSPLDPWVVGGSAYEITPSTLSFSSPATLTIRYDQELRPSGTAPQDFRIHRLVGSSWAPLSGTNDPLLSEATAPITTTGVYSIRWTGPTAPCLLTEDRQFDFWLGEWDLVDETLGLPGRPAGTNHITRDETGCVIQEDYRASVQGRSLSLFSRADRRWHQTYIDSAGNRGVLIGSFEGGRMVLVAGARRSYWEPLDANTVHFVQDLSRDGGVTWVAFFDSRYLRR